LIVKVRWTMPDVPMICILRHSEDALCQEIKDDIAIHFLHKPFRLKHLAGNVKEVIAL